MMINFSMIKILNNLQKYKNKEVQIIKYNKMGRK